MKHSFGQSLGVALLTAAMSITAGAQSISPAEVDFGKLPAPTSGGEFVEVNISSNVIALVTTLTKKDNPEIGDLLHGLQHIRVNVVGLDDGNRSDLKDRVKKLRDKLDSEGWERMVTAQQKDEDVAVHIKTRGGEAVQGLVVTVIDGDKEAVLVNIVGDIKPEQLSAIGERFNIDPLKKLPPFVKKS